MFLAEACPLLCGRTKPKGGAGAPHTPKPEVEYAEGFLRPAGFPRPEALKLIFLGYHISTLALSTTAQGLTQGFLLPRAASAETIFRFSGGRMGFFSNERVEPPHWLQPCPGPNWFSQLPYDLDPALFHAHCPLLMGHAPSKTPN